MLLVHVVDGLFELVGLMFVVLEIYAFLLLEVFVLVFELSDTLDGFFEFVLSDVSVLFPELLDFVAHHSLDFGETLLSCSFDSVLLSVELYFSIQHHSLDFVFPLGPQILVVLLFLSEVLLDHPSQFVDLSLLALDRSVEFPHLLCEVLNFLFLPGEDQVVLHSFGGG